MRLNHCISPFLIAAACSLILLSACVTAEEPLSALPNDDRTDTPTVTLQASVLGPMDPATRLDSDRVSGIHVFAFDDNGYLVEHAEAYGLLYGQGADGMETTFSVDLTATSDYRRLHLVAGTSVGSVPFGTESQTMGAMATTGGAAAYWQYAELPGGIADGGSYPSLRRVPMVRNTATVSMTSTAEGFTLLGFRVVNVPTWGCVAAWVPGTGPFAGYRSESSPVYATIHSAGYRGFMPAGHSELSSTAMDLTEKTVYEHPFTGDADTYTYIILKGRLAGEDHDTYYKLDLVRDNGSGGKEYMDILRNIRYSITISSVDSGGYDTEAEAASHAAGNNIGGTVNADSLDNISDGRGHLFVSTTELLLVSDDAVTVRYKYIPDIINAPTVTSNGSATVSAPAGAVLSAAGSVAASDDSDGWRTVTLRPYSPGLVVYNQTITISTPAGLSKIIRLTLRAPYVMTASVTPSSVDQEIGESVAVAVTLPDDLPESLFPLRLVLSTADDTLYPDADRNGLSLEMNGGEYGYVRTVTRDEYEDEDGIIVSYFLTNKRHSATTVRVDNEYFTRAEAPLANNTRYVTSFTIPAASMTVTGLFAGFDSVYMYYDINRNNRINSTSYRFFPFGLKEDTTVTVNSMPSSSMIYLYNVTRRTIVGVAIDDLEAGGVTIAFN